MEKEASALVCPALDTLKFLKPLFRQLRVVVVETKIFIEGRPIPYLDLIRKRLFLEMD